MFLMRYFIYNMYTTINYNIHVDTTGYSIRHTSQTSQN